MDLDRLLPEAGSTPRDIPDALRARLERAILAEASPERAGSNTGATGEEEGNPLRGADAPRALLSEARVRVEHAVSNASRGALEGLDEPRPMPAKLDAAVYRALVARRRRGASAARMGAAAAAVLVFVSSGLFVGGGGEGPRTTTLPGAGSGGTTGSVTSPSEEPGLAVPSMGGTGSGGGAAEPIPQAGSPGVGGAPASGSDAPPFAFGSDTASDTREAGKASTRRPTLDARPLRVAVVAGDNSPQDAAFRGYVTLLNAAGGIRGRTIELVPTSAGAPAAGVVATVNLSSRPVATSAGAPSWAPLPLLETLSAPESALKGGVFSTASVPERQGHLIADALFPSSSPGSRAVIYFTRGEPFETRIPEAIERVLRVRGVTPVRVPYDPSLPTTFVEAEAAFLSMRLAPARAWSAGAQQSSFNPGGGVAGVYSLLGSEALAALPSGTLIVSPYAPAVSSERRALEKFAGTADDSEALHGWSTAKTLAVALWRSGAVDGSSTVAALRALTGYEHALAPPYEVRPGTNSRTPEGILLRLGASALTANGAWRRDGF